MKSERNSRSGQTLVVGMGISGQSVCELLLRQGVQVIGNDIRSRESFEGSLEALEGKGCLLRLGFHDPEDFVNADRIIVSPGIPLDVEPLRMARDKGIEIIGELDWAWRQVKVPTVAVTGTNGKTTTTSLLGEMFKAAGRRVFVGGNIGTPLSRWLLEGETADLLVLEVSSFQLDTASQFAPDVGVLLNITEDHLDRYEDFEAYVESKLSIFSRQGPAQVAVVNLDDPLCRQRAMKVPGRLLLSGRNDPRAHASIEGRRVRVGIPGKEPFQLSLERCRLKGIHNEENILAAVLAAAALDVSPDVLQQVLDVYRGLPHRVEWVGNWRGVDFYDDSKGTNVGAVVKALENFPGRVLLFLGGRDKLGSYGPLAEVLKHKGKKAFVFGEAAPRLQAALESSVSTQSYPDLGAAFADAMTCAEPGDVVLLSPACSSFDQYTSYAQRGNHFKSLVRGLPEIVWAS